MILVRRHDDVSRTATRCTRRRGSLTERGLDPAADVPANVAKLQTLDPRTSGADVTIGEVVPPHFGKLV
jgi:hypothetical protein